MGVAGDEANEMTFATAKSDRSWPEKDSKKFVFFVEIHFSNGYK